MASVACQIATAMTGGGSGEGCRLSHVTELCPQVGLFPGRWPGTGPGAAIYIASFASYRHGDTSTYSDIHIPLTVHSLISATRVWFAKKCHGGIEQLVRRDSSRNLIKDSCDWLTACCLARFGSRRDRLVGCWLALAWL